MYDASVEADYIHSGGWTGYTFPMDYCYPDRRATVPPFDGACDAWQRHSYEWRSIAFEEGFADFVAAVALYQPTASAPDVCSAQYAPGAGLFGTPFCFNSTTMETSKGSSECEYGEFPDDRQPRNVSAFLWDVYDTVDDPTYSDVVSVDVKLFFEALTSITPGTSLYEQDAPWNAALTEISEPDERSAADYEPFLSALTEDPVLPLISLLNNCAAQD